VSGLVVLVVVGVLVAVALGHYFGEARRIRRQLRALPRVRIGQAAERQLVRLEGRVLDGESLSAPLTGRRCVFYVALVEEYVSNGKSGRWRQRARETRGVPFAIEDGSGRAVIDASGGRLDVQLDSTTQSGTFDDATAVEEAFLARHGLRSEGWLFNKRLRYREGVIEIGETVACAGRAVREPDPDAVARGTGYREGPPTRLRVGGSAEAPLLLSDATEVTRG
jgi:hypothetical protein